MSRGISIYNGTGEIKKVILYKPNKEFINLLPENLLENEMIDFPDIIELSSSFDALANVLRNEKIKVVYIQDLLAECFRINGNIREKFIKQFIREALVPKELIPSVYHILSSINNNRELINKCILGIRKDEVDLMNNSLLNLVNSPRLIIPPLVNMLHLHDNVAFIGNGVLFNTNRDNKRYRELIFWEYIFKYHPQYKNYRLYNSRFDNMIIDVQNYLVLNDEVIMIGLTKKNDVETIMKISKNILTENTFKHVLILDLKDNKLPLKSLITMLDYTEYLIHSSLNDSINIYEIGICNNELVVNEELMSLERVLMKYLHQKKIDLITCGDDYFSKTQEEIKGACNSLVLKEGVVLVYKNNYYTNQKLIFKGYHLITIKSDAFLKWHGGVSNIVVPLIRL